MLLQNIFHDLTVDTPLAFEDAEDRGLAARAAPALAADALVSRMGVVPAVAAKVDDMTVLGLETREDSGLAVKPPIVAQDEFMPGPLVKAVKLDGFTGTFLAVSRSSGFPNALLPALLASHE